MTPRPHIASACPRSPHGPLGRRSLLRASAATLGGLALTTLAGPASRLLAAPADPKPPRYKTRRVIVVAFAGGVRQRDVLGMPQNVPNLLRIAKTGTVLTAVRAANLGHYGAALAIFTGCPESQGIRENARGQSPTLFEYLRKHANLPAHEVWLSTTAGAQTVNFAYGTHADYGAKYGANLISTDGLFNAEFRDLIRGFGQVSVPSAEETARVERLARSLDPSWLDGAAGDGLANDPSAGLRIQRYILEELRGDTATITGPGAGDAKSVRVARNLLRLFRPKVVGIVLQNADVAHGSYNAYLDVVRRNDAEIGLLWDAVQADRDLRDTTTLLVLPEFGRDAALNQRNGLDHGDGSEDLHRVFCIVAGPDVKPDRVVQKPVDAFDVCPTLADLFDVPTDQARGKALRMLWA